MSQTDVIVLAAGKGTRMLSDKPKVMHEIMGRPMIGHVVSAATGLNPHKIIVVTGHGREAVEDYLKSSPVSFAVQDPQLGTAHALLVCGDSLGSNDVLVLYGDVPLIQRQTLQSIMAIFARSDGIVFMTTETATPDGYGRVIMNDGCIEAIVEDNDATEEQKKIREINTGICMLRADRLPLLKKIGADNRKREYYLTDICLVAQREGIKVGAYHHPDSREVLGVNTRQDQTEANLIMKDRKLDLLLSQGVTLVSRDIYIESEVEVGRDSIIYPNCYLGGRTRIGQGVVVWPNSVIIDSTVEDGAIIKGISRLEGAVVGRDTEVDPPVNFGA
ncbi:MAG TPA: bifunctional N-acetylglucosamine-1-phosphate uridyltransferase/glucosamine-1-phosphate acetyltransferase [Deltaproteobacteria bacterium]|nr:bifunctional N-acetylglucosamine-1-phosphate uridyltransferase/glucosamine-1-phosphate acetyltransferase [Deltaproteobacteria bacterium]